MSDPVFHYKQRQLENDFVALEPFEPDVHMTYFVEMIKANPDMFAYIPFPVIKDEADFMREVYTGISTSSGDCLFAVIDKVTSPEKADTDGKYAGVISLTATSLDNAVTEIGVMIFPAFQGTHVATNAIGLLLLWVMDPPSAGGIGLRRIGWHTHADNVVSRKVASRMGFEFEGVLRWDRVFPRGRIVLSAEALRARNGTQEEQPGRHTAIYSIVWDEWDEKRPNIIALMERSPRK